MHCEAGPRSHPTKTRFRRRRSQTNRAGPRQHPSAHCRPSHAAGTAWLSMEACTQMNHQRPCACRPVLSAPGGLAGPQDYSRRCAAPFHSRASRHEAGGSEHKATPANQAACAASAAGFRCHRALQLTTIGIELRKANPTDRPCRARIGRRQVELATAPLHRRASRQATHQPHTLRPVCTALLRPPLPCPASVAHARSTRDPWAYPVPKGGDL